MLTVNPTIGLFSLVVGVLVSLIFSYVPRLNVWFAEKGSEYKQVFMLGLGVLTSLVLIGLACFNLISGIACTRDGVFEVLIALIGWVVGNQSTHSISPPVRAVKAAKLGAKLLDSSQVK